MRKPRRARQIIPVVEERVEVDKQPLQTAYVRVHVTPRQREQVVEVPLTDEQVEIERVPVNQEVDGNHPPGVRQDGDVTIIPVFEEVVVVQKRLMVKEEIRLHRRRSTRTERQTVTLRREEVRIDRVEGPAARRAPRSTHSTQR